MTATETFSREKPRIGEGIFTLNDVANILKLDKRQVKYWVSDYAAAKYKASKAHKYIFGYDDLKGINFFSLIEIFVFYSLKKKGIDAKSIINAHEALSAVYDTPYPFAKAKILTSGKDIIFNHENSMIKADKSLQRYITKVINQFAEKIEFDKNSDIAQRYFPMGKKHAIVVDPKRQFGQPIIDGTSIKATTIYSHFVGGDKKEFISKIYNISLSQVNDAIAYFEAAA